MVLGKDEFFKRLENLVGDDDESLTLIEDFTDTFNDLESKANSDEWEKKYNELDAKWREKYKSRFFNTSPDEVKKEQEDDVKRDETAQTYEDLFEEREG